MTEEAKHNIEIANSRIRAIEIFILPFEKSEEKINKYNDEIKELYSIVCDSMKELYKNKQ